MKLWLRVWCLVLTHGVERTVRLQARDPLAVGVIASEVVADRRVDGAVVVAFAIQNERKRAALRRNRRRLVAFVNIQV